MWKNLTKFFSEADYPNRQKKKKFSSDNRFESIAIYM